MAGGGSLEHQLQAAPSPIQDRGSSHLGTRETSFTGATSFTRRTFGTSRSGSTTFTGRTLSGEKSQTHQGHSLGLITTGLASSSCWEKVLDFEGDSWGCQREAKQEEEGDTAVVARQQGAQADMSVGGCQPYCQGSDVGQLGESASLPGREITLGPATPSAPGKPRLPGPPCREKEKRPVSLLPSQHWASTKSK